MQKFGEIFKKFRESRGIRLKDVAQKLVSRHLNCLVLKKDRQT